MPDGTGFGAPGVTNDAVAASTDPAVRRTGKVKWFDATRGFGFVVVDDGDALLHFSVLRSHGRRTLPEGVIVNCMVIKGNRGLQVSEVIDFDLASAVGPDLDLRYERRDSTDLNTLLVGAGPFQPVRVKWFNRMKGYGFLIGEDGADIFVHMETIRRAGLYELETDQLLRARVVQGDKGLMAALVEVVDA